MHVHDEPDASHNHPHASGEHPLADHVLMMLPLKPGRAGQVRAGAEVQMRANHRPVRRFVCKTLSRSRSKSAMDSSWT